MQIQTLCMWCTTQEYYLNDMQLCYVGCTSFKVVENISKTFLFLFYKWNFVPMHIIMNCNRVTAAAFFLKPTFPTAFWFWKLWWLFENQFKTGLKFWQWVFRQCLIRDGKRFCLKWNNIFFQHHFRSKTIYFSIFSTPILWQSECP